MMTGMVAGMAERLVGGKGKEIVGRNGVWRQLITEQT